MTNILSISAHDDIRRIMNRLVNKQDGWKGQAAADLSQAEALLSQEKFDLILIGAGISQADEVRLKEFCSRLSYQTKLVQHYGGGSGLLYSEVMVALAA